MAKDLPSFEDMRRNAYALLGDAEDELRSDWRPGTGPNAEQAAALHLAKMAIAQAKSHLNTAATAASFYNVEQEQRSDDDA